MGAWTARKGVHLHLQRGKLLQAGADGELLFQTLPAEGIPELLLVEIFHVSSRFLSFSKPFGLGSLALRRETQRPPHGK